jgi:hypothetical protein
MRESWRTAVRRRSWVLALALQPRHRVMKVDADNEKGLKLYMTIFRHSIRPSATFFYSRSSICKIFNMLRQDKWFNAWLLMAGMEMADKSSFVRYGYSVDLDRFERFGKSSTRRVSWPLACWRKTIEKFRSEGRPWRLLPLLRRWRAAHQSTWDPQRQLSVLICHFDKERHQAQEKCWHQKSADTRKGSGTRKALTPGKALAPEKC